MLIFPDDLREGGWDKGAGELAFYAVIRNNPRSAPAWTCQTCDVLNCPRVT